MGFRNINVSVTADTAGYEAALKRASAATRQFKSASQGSVAAPVGDPSRTNQATAALGNYKAMTQQVARAQMQSGDMLAAASQKGTAAQKHLAAAQIMVRDAMNQSAGATNIFSKGVSFATGMAKQLIAVSGGFMLIHGFVNAVSRSVSFMKNSFLDWNKEMNESLAIMQDVTPEMRKMLETTTKAVSTFTTFTPAEAAEALYFLASAGYTAAQSNEMVGTTAIFAQAGVMDLAKASEMLTDIQKAMNQPPDLKNDWSTENTLFDPNNLELTAKGAKRVADVITKASIDSNATVEEIGAGLQNKLSAYARQIGMTMEEATSMVEALSSRGIKGATAGTQSYIALRDLMRTALKNPDKYGAAGIQVFDEKGEMKKFNEIIAQFESKLGPMSDAARKAFFSDLGFQDRALSSIMTFIGTSTEMAGYLNENLKNSNGYAEKVAKNQLDSVANHMALIRNFFARLGADVGTQLVAGWTKVTEIMGPAVKAAISAFKGLWEAAKPVTNFLAKAVGGAFVGSLTTVAKVIEWLSAIVEKFPGLAAGMLGVFALNKVKSMELFTNSMFRMGQSFGSMPAFGNFMKGQGGIFSQAAGKMQASFKGLTGMGKGKNPMQLISLAQAKTGNIPKVRARLEEYTEAYRSQYVKMSMIRTKWTAMAKDGIIPIGKGVSQIGKGVLQGITLPFAVAAKTVQTSIWGIVASVTQSKLVNALVHPFATAKSAASAAGTQLAKLGAIPGRLADSFNTTKLAGGIASLFSPINAVSRAFGTAMGAMNTARTRTQQGFTSMKNAMVSTFQDAPIRLSNALATIPSFIQSTSSKISLGMSSMGAKIASAFKTPIQTASSAFNTIPVIAGVVSQRVGGVFDKMKSRLSSGFTATSKAFGNVWSGTTDVFGKISSGAASAATSVRKAASTMGSSLWTAFKSIPGRIGSAFTAARQSTGAFFQGVVQNAKDSAAKVAQSFTNGFANIKAGGQGINAAKSTANLSQAKENAMKAQYIMLLQQEALATENQILLDAAKARGASGATVSAIEAEGKLIAEKRASIDATMASIATETELAAVRKLAYANSGTAAPTALGKIGAGFGKVASAAGTGLMAAMLLAPGMLSDMDNRLKDQKDKLTKTLKDNYSVNIDEVLDKGTFDELRAAADATGKELDKANKVLGDTDTSNLDVLGETLFGWIPGVEETAKDAKAKSATAQNTANDVNKDLLDVMQGTLKVKQWADKNRGVGNGKNWMDALSFEDQQRKLNDQIVKMGGSIKSGKDRVAAFTALQQEFMNIHLANPEMNWDEISDAVGGADAEAARETIDETSKAFEEAFSAMFNSEKIMEDAHALAENLRTALKTPAQVASDVQKDIDDALKKNADASAKAYNEGIESQVENIEKQKKRLNEVASDSKKKTKSDTKKESIDDANDAQIAALDEQKDALQDTKKSSEDYAQERKMSIEEFISGMQKAKTESDTFNGTLAIMSQMGLKDDVVAQFREMGEDAVPLLAEFRGKSEEEMRKFVENFNSSMGELGKKPVPTMEELTKKYAEAAAAQRKFTANLFEISQIAGAQGRPINADQIEALVTTLGPDSQVLIQNFLDGFNGSVDNPALQSQMSDEFFGLTKDVFDASNVYTDGFSESMKTAMNAATMVVSDSAAQLLTLISDTGDQAAEDALRTAAEVEVAIGSGTKFQKAYYDFIQKKNGGTGGQNPFVEGGDQTAIQGQAVNDSKRSIMEGKEGQGQTAQGDDRVAKRYEAIDKYNNAAISNNEQKRKFWNTESATDTRKVIMKAFDKKASQEELEALAKKAATYGKLENHSIPRYAKGDIVTKPTLGVFGEDGPEVILPLSKRGRMIELLKKALGKTGGVPQFGNGAMFGAKEAMNGTRKLLDGYSQMGAGVESSASQARSEMSTPASRPASYDMINASASGPSGGNIVVVPVPVESKTEYQFNGPIQGLTLEQVQADAQRKKRQAALV